MSDKVLSDEIIELIENFANSKYKVASLDIDDYKQELFMTYLNCRDRFDPNKISGKTGKVSSFKDYLLSAMVHTCYRLNNKNTMKQSKEITLQSDYVIEDNTDIVEDLVRSKFLTEASILLGSIPNGKATYYIIFEGMSKTDTANKLGISRPTLDKYHNDNIRHLKLWMKEGK